VHCDCLEKGKANALKQQDLAEEYEDAINSLGRDKDDEHTESLILQAVRDRFTEHRMRCDGVEQMRVFAECIGHLPRLPKDILNLLSQIVCDFSLYLFGGCCRDEKDQTLIPSDSSYRIHKKGQLEHLAPMPTYASLSFVLFCSFFVVP
jgi:hypothetical protein